MNKQIRLLIESFFDDEIFNVENDIKSDIEDLGRYYDYKVGEIYYQNKKPYAVCCGDKSYFNDNKPRFCLLNDSVNDFKWSTSFKIIKELNINNIPGFYLSSINDFKHIDENGYENTQVIKNNYYISDFPAFKYCINLGDNVYLPAIDELQMMYLNKDKQDIYSFSGDYYWSSTQYSATFACINKGYVTYYNKNYYCHVRPFFYLN